MKPFINILVVLVPLALATPSVASVAVMASHPLTGIDKQKYDCKTLCKYVDI